MYFTSGVGLSECSSIPFPGHVSAVCMGGSNVEIGCSHEEGGHEHLHCSPGQESWQEWGMRSFCLPREKTPGKCMGWLKHVALRWGEGRLNPWNCIMYLENYLSSSEKQHDGRSQYLLERRKVQRVMRPTYLHHPGSKQNGILMAGYVCLWAVTSNDDWRTVFSSYFHCLIIFLQSYLRKDKDLLTCHLCILILR